MFPLKDNKMEFSDVDYIDTWKEMEKAYHEGLATNIGVSNFNSEQLRRLIENCKVKPVTNQVSNKIIKFYLTNKIQETIVAFRLKCIRI